MNKTDSLKYIDYEFIQDEDRYKVNTDTVCLGMFLDPLIGKTVLDIGTNTGALLLYAHTSIPISRIRNGPCPHCEWRWPIGMSMTTPFV